MLSIPELAPFVFLYIWILRIAKNNLQTIVFADVLIILGIFAAVGLGLFLTRFLWEDRRRAGLFLPLATIVFFAYGNLFDSLSMSFHRALTPVGIHSLLLAVSFGVLALAHILLSRTKVDLTPIIKLLNFFLVALAIMITVESVQFYRQIPVREPYRPPAATGSASATNSIAATGPISATGSIAATGSATVLPDVYFVVLDGFSRTDVLKEMFSYDNSSFTRALTAKGFFVAGKSTSNYPHTYLSLLSMLEGQYVHDLLLQSFDLDDVLDRMRANSTMAAFTRHGYRLVTYKSGFDCSHFSPTGDITSNQFLSLREFADFVLGRTMLCGIFAVLPTPLTDPLPARFREVLSPVAGHRDRVRFIFDEMSRSHTGSPVFTFVHLVSPHPPFIFDSTGRGIEPPYCFTYADGGDLRQVFTPEEYKKGYVEQLHFIQDRVIRLVSGLIDRRGERPLAIILCSDHGPGCYFRIGNLEESNLRERFSNLVAVHFSDGSPSALHPAITPVNLVRILRSTYLGENLPLLEDRNFFVQGTNVFPPFTPQDAKIIDVTGSLDRPDQPMK